MLVHKIKEFCEISGITIAELERKAEIPPRTIYSWSNVMPAADRLLKVANILNTTVDELLKEE